MGGLYLYAILADHPGSALVKGVRGECLSIVAAGSFPVAVGVMSEPPPLTPTSLHRHDRAIRELGRSVPAILPCRFGEWAEDLAMLDARIATRGEELEKSLRRVKGCEQMTLRIFGLPCPGPRPAEQTDHARGGPGTRYLVGRSRRAALVASALAPLRAWLADRLRAEHVEIHSSGRLLASAYHLVPRGAANLYAGALRELGATDGTVRLAASGPWPPYAFARGDAS